MKKIISSAVAAGLLLGSTAAVAQDATFDRAPANVEEAENLEGGTLLIILLIAAAIAGAIFLIEESGDEDDLPTSP